jgi:hypothetical protein
MNHDDDIATTLLNLMLNSNHLLTLYCDKVSRRLRVLLFPPPIKLTAMVWLKYWFKHHKTHQPTFMYHGTDQSNNIHTCGVGKL